jgi:hypothetical protein
MLSKCTNGSLVSYQIHSSRQMRLSVSKECVMSDACPRHRICYWRGETDPVRSLGLASALGTCVPGTSLISTPVCDLYQKDSAYRQWISGTISLTDQLQERSRQGTENSLRPTHECIYTHTMMFKTPWPCQDTMAVWLRQQTRNLFPPRKCIQ